MLVNDILLYKKVRECSSIFIIFGCLCICDIYLKGMIIVCFEIIYFLECYIILLLF